MKRCTDTIWGSLSLLLWDFSEVQHPKRVSQYVKLKMNTDVILITREKIGKSQDICLYYQLPNIVMYFKHYIKVEEPMHRQIV